MNINKHGLVADTHLLSKFWPGWHYTINMLYAIFSKLNLILPKPTFSD